MTCIGEIADEVNLHVKSKQLILVVHNSEGLISALFTGEVKVRFLLSSLDLNNSNTSSPMSQQTS